MSPAKTKNKKDSKKKKKARTCILVQKTIPTTGSGDQIVLYMISDVILLCFNF